MVELNQDKTVDLNAMAVEIAKKEAGAKESDIGQIKELMKDFAQYLKKIEKDHNQEKMLEAIDRLAK